jgi:hypothetical protein
LFDQAVRGAASLSREFDCLGDDFFGVDEDRYFSEPPFFPMSAAIPLISFEIDLELGRRANRARKLSKRANLLPHSRICQPSLLKSLEHLIAYTVFCLRKPRAAVGAYVK